MQTHEQNVSENNRTPVKMICCSSYAISTWRSSCARVRSDAVNGVSFNVRQGKTLGVIGESGSGKSVTAQAIMRLTPPSGFISGGEILLHRAERIKKEPLDLAKVSSFRPRDS